jgi:hypothetical protein
LGVEVQGNAQLMEIAFALSSGGLAFGVAEGSGNRADENAYDRDNYQQFREREPGLGF